MFLLLRSISLWFSLPEVEEEKKRRKVRLSRVPASALARVRHTEMHRGRRDWESSLACWACTGNVDNGGKEERLHLDLAGSHSGSLG